MKTGHWVLIGLGLVVLYLLFSPSSKSTVPAYGVGGSWYDKMLATVGLGLGTYVRTAGPNAFGSGASTSGGVRTSNPANDSNVVPGYLTTGGGAYTGITSRDPELLSSSDWDDIYATRP